MAYEFKKLSDVAAVDTPADTANVLIEEDGVIKKVARGTMVPITKAIPLPETASVGQIFKISEVDENGKVTAVEAVDMPSGEGSTSSATITMDELIINGTSYGIFEQDSDSYELTLISTNAYNALNNHLNNGGNVTLILRTPDGYLFFMLKSADVTMSDQFVLWFPFGSDDIAYHVFKE